MYKETVGLYKKTKKSCKTHCNDIYLNKRDFIKISQLGGAMGQEVDVLKSEVVGDLLKKMELM